MRAPAGLGPRGRALWGLIQKGLPDGWELDERECSILALAARQADDLAALERSIKKHGVTVAGSAGQPRLNAAVVEARQARQALGRLLGQLALPDEDSQPATEAAKRARHAAEVRWAMAAEKRERRRHG